jgi:hypothetical protein
MRSLSTILLAAAVLAGGCQSEQYRTQPLGDVEYDRAFNTGRDVLAQYFSLERADPRSGEIVSRPRPVEAEPQRLLGVGEARQLAQMRIRREDDRVVADLRVLIQRQDTEAAMTMQPVTADNELPGHTPVDETAPLTKEQQQVWRTTGRDEALERMILEDLLEQLAGGQE